MTWPGTGKVARPMALAAVSSGCAARHRSIANLHEQGLRLAGKKPCDDAKSTIATDVQAADFGQCERRVCIRLQHDQVFQRETRLAGICRSQQENRCFGVSIHAKAPVLTFSSCWTT